MRGRGRVLLLQTMLGAACLLLTTAPQRAGAREAPSYSIQVGAFKEDERARNLVERLTGRGVLAFQREEEVTGRGTWTTVFIGKYPTREAATRHAEELRREGILSEFLIRETGIETDNARPALEIGGIEFKAESADKEVVLIRASRPFSPAVFPLEEGHLRLVIDIVDALPYRKGPTELPVGGNFIEKIRMFYHPDIRTQRVVLDLAPSKSYKIHQLFFEKENTFAVVVEKKTAEVPEGASPPARNEKPSYRSEGTDLKPGDLKAMLLEHRFFSSCWNHNQDFCNPDGSFENLFVEDDRETIRDRASRLVWQKGGSQKAMTWNEARVYVNRLNRDHFAGHADWRLPTTEELATLVERSWQEKPLFISPRFEAAQSSCWTVDTMGEERAWAVSFHLGHFFHSPMSFEHHVRAVRSDTR